MHKPEATGFIEGQSLSGTTRNWYANESWNVAARFAYNQRRRGHLD
ncbi:hypothetical protein [Pseudomonas peli]|nr:hypothetical protein [Pseudomonas peli]